MAIKKLSIKGLRAFSEKTDIKFAIPDNKTPGSGLTVLVGANNSGKSTVVEAIHLISNNTNIVPISSRNIKTDTKLEIEVEDIIGNTYTVNSTKNKGAFIERRYNNAIINGQFNNIFKTFILSSKRSFSSTFNNNTYQDRENYKGNINDSDYRTENNINNNFGGRLLTIYKNRKQFDECLKKVLNPLPNWTIEASDAHNLYLEFDFNGIKHSSRGAGDGFINIFNIIDALYDSSEDNVILIDEPEVSLHPDLQRKLFEVLVEYSKDKQIIINTHSPYFVDWKIFSSTAKILRLKKENNSIKIFELTNKSKDGIIRIISDAHNPHILSLDSNDVFFLNDNIILTEGQDDVLCYKEIFRKYGYKSTASFFGWGAGGAPKIKFILNILNDLGYEKVFIILDNDKKNMIKELKEVYPQYEIYAIETNDVRDKKRRTEIEKIVKKIEELDIDNKDKILDYINSNFKSTKGLVKSMSTYEINEEYNQDIINLIEKLKKYFVNKKSTVTEKVDTQVKEDIKENDKLLAQHLLYQWLDKNKLSEQIQRKYNKFEFRSGGGGELSFKKINENIYYAIIEETNSMSENYSIVINYHIIINTLKNKVRLKRKKVIVNTLPINIFSKFLEKIFN